MTNSINVPRELLERAAKHLSVGRLDGPAAHELRALLSAPSPAGVDGLEVVATLLIDDPADQECGDWDIEVESKVAERMAELGGGQHDLCRLSDASAALVAQGAAKDISSGDQGWRTVPIEPTREMLEAAEEAHMPFGDMDIALRMAILSAPSAPATVQGVNQQMLEALEAIAAEDYQAPHDATDFALSFDKGLCISRMKRIATAAIAAARKGE